MGLLTETASFSQLVAYSRVTPPVAHCRTQLQFARACQDDSGGLLTVATGLPDWVAPQRRLARLTVFVIRPRRSGGTRTERRASTRLAIDQARDQALTLHGQPAGARRGSTANYLEYKMSIEIIAFD